MSKEQLLALRARCAGKHPGTQAETTILEVLDGAMTLREIDGQS